MQRGFNFGAIVLAMLGVLNGPAVSAQERIVTLTPGIAEWSAAILGEAKAKKKLIGVSEYSLYPSFLSTVTSVGPYPQLNIEKIAALKPDLVLASAESTRAEQLDQLKRLKLKVIILESENFNSMPEWIGRLGSVLKESESAKGVTKQWSSELITLKKNAKPKNRTLFLEVQHEPLVTVGRPSFLNDAFKAIGYQNVFGQLEQAYPKVSKEAVLKADPDQIFILDLTGSATDFEKAKEDWQKLGSIKAVKHSAIQTLPGDDFARCSLRLLKGLKALH